jgi:hypothetical protein
MPWTARNARVKRQAWLRKQLILAGVRRSRATIDKFYEPCFARPGLYLSAICAIFANGFNGAV